MTTYKIFDRSRLRIKPLSKRESDLSINSFLNLDSNYTKIEHPDFGSIARDILDARKNKSSVMLIMGAHVIKAGVSRYIIDLMEKDFITHVAMNGAGPIHEFELAMKGQTTESVARYIKTGEFGLWRETGKLNDIIKHTKRKGMGMGEGIGKFIEESSYRFKDISILAAGWRLKIPVTVHVGIGYDIIYEHPNCDGAAMGETSYRDFLIFANSVENLEGGVVLCFGTAVMGPEIFLKALAMARNVSADGRRVAGSRRMAAMNVSGSINRFSVAVFDIVRIDGDFRKQPDKTNPQYYYRPWKTLLVRTVAGGGKSYYICGDHSATVPSLYHSVTEEGHK